MTHDDNIIIGDVNNKDIVTIDNLEAEGNVPCEEQHGKVKKGLKGILTDHITGKQKEVDLDYRIDIRSDKYKEFVILSPIIGYKSFNIYNCYVALDDIIDNGWDACDGRDYSSDDIWKGRDFIPSDEICNSKEINKYDKLFIPSCEIKKAFERENFCYEE